MASHPAGSQSSLGAGASQPRVAIVTGGNRGIGLATCAALARLGLHVILASRDAATGEAAARTLRDAGTVTSHQLDVTDDTGIARLRDHVIHEYGRADVLINNAGIYPDEGISIFDLDLDLLRTTLEINLHGPFRMCQALVPLMRRNGYGRVVNLSSGLGQLASMGGHTPAYRISKAALHALTRIVAAETSGADIKVNAIDPGWVRTDMGGPTAPVDPADAASAVAWLATLPPNGPTGAFFNRHRQPLDW